jgi:hypothetical protein
LIAFEASLNGTSFDVLDAPHNLISDPVGWSRGGEHWIRPDTWRDTIFDGDEDAAQDAARLLRDLGLLRVQDGRNCQAVVCVRERKSARAYVLKPEIRDWRPQTPAYGAYDAAQIGLSYSQDNGSPALVPVPAGGSPSDLSAKLENLVSMALDEAERILRVQVPPDDRAYQAVLRAKTAIFNGALINQVRVDETRLRVQQDRGDRIKEILARVKAFKQEELERDKEDARLAREKGWCDDSLSDKTAAAIYRERTYPWLSYREKPGHPRSSNGS